jgi:hypothetical protein
MVLLTSNLSNCTRLYRLKRRILSRVGARVIEIFYRVETRSPPVLQKTPQILDERLEVTVTDTG